MHTNEGTPPENHSNIMKKYDFSKNTTSNLASKSNLCYKIFTTRQKQDQLILFLKIQTAKNKDFTVEPLSAVPGNRKR